MEPSPSQLRCLPPCAAEDCGEAMWSASILALPWWIWSPVWSCHTTAARYFVMTVGGLAVKLNRQTAAGDAGAQWYNTMHQIHAPALGPVPCAWTVLSSSRSADHLPSMTERQPHVTRHPTHIWMHVSMFVSSGYKTWSTSILLRRLRSILRGDMTQPVIPIRKVTVRQSSYAFHSVTSSSIQHNP